MRKFLCAILLFPSLCIAQQYKGLDILGLAKQDCAMIAQTITQGTAIGVLDGTFGEPSECLQKLISTGKVSAFRTHLLNGTCFRNKVCEAGEPRPTDTRAIQRRAEKWQRFSERNPNIPCFISPVLEHDIRDRAAAERNITTVKAAAPRCTVVQSAFTGYRVPGVLNEYHGNKAKGDITSNDGESHFDSDSEKYRTSGRIITFSWVNRDNLRYSGEKTFTPPSKRKAKLSKTDVIHRQRLLLPIETKPTSNPPQCRTVRELKERELWKPQAEEYNTSDPREKKPLLITKSRSSRMTIISAKNWKEVGCVRFYGTYSGDKGYFRHYVGSCSGDSSVSLMNKAQGEWVYLFDRGNCLLINSIRRSGYFR